MSRIHPIKVHGDVGPQPAHVGGTGHPQNSDILLKVDSPIPVSSRLGDLPKIVAKEADKLLVVRGLLLYYLI